MVEKQGAIAQERSVGRSGVEFSLSPPFFPIKQPNHEKKPDRREGGRGADRVRPTCRRQAASESNRVTDKPSCCLLHVPAAMTWAAVGGGCLDVS